MHEIAKLQEAAQGHSLPGTGHAVHGFRHLHQAFLLPDHIEPVINDEKMAQQLIHSMGFLLVPTG